MKIGYDLDLEGFHIVYYHTCGVLGGYYEL